ncbi:uncharacterized protein [Macrobrachium rosenbergii]|uniref:uncharacterized protein n=1 Tax=Macrobrachium rosenbergii TaxID=79674 RepID=UPI0034D642E1
MASAALNAGLLEALVVSRGATSQNSGDSNNHPGSPNSTGEEPTPNHHSYLHAHFQGVTSHFSSEVDAHDVSTSGGDVTTEDDEGSLNDPISNYYRSLGEEQQLSASAKKRRKQSKPVRLPTPQGEPGVTQETAASKQEEAQFDSEMSNPSAEGDDNITCQHCNLEVPTEDSLRRHIIEEHIGQLLNDDVTRQHQQQRHQQHMKLELEPGEQRIRESEGTPLNLSSPKWDDRPSSRHHGGFSPPTSVPMPPSFNDVKLSLPNLLPLGPPPFLLPFIHPEHERYHGIPHSQQTSSPSSSSGQQNRIFNQEAYCELCHKEFCNKYFLKTHKANKHGIYSPEVSSSPTGIPSGHSTPLGPTVPLTSPLGPSISAGNIPGSPYAGAFITANMNTLPLRPLLPTQHSANKMMSANKDSSASNKTGGVINLEAYCELCQKEFCNKYFLKRHKAKIHGISIDVVIKPKNHGQIPPRVAPDRPEGWCDACRRDIGGRVALNAHKLQAHGPHIVAPLPSPHNTSPQTARNPRTPTPKESRKDFPDHRELRDYFSPWDAMKDPREVSRESWDGEVPRDIRESKDGPIRSPWDRPLGSPWDGVREIPRNDPHRESAKENSSDLVNNQDFHRNEPWNNEDNHRGDHHDKHSGRGRLPSIGNVSDTNEFPLDKNDIQAIREQHHRDWEMRQKALEHQRERERQFIKLEQDRELQAREREHQQREDQQREQAHLQWERERERELMMLREQQLEMGMHERERENQSDMKHLHQLEIKQESQEGDSVQHNSDKQNEEKITHEKNHFETDRNSTEPDSLEEGQVTITNKETTNLEKSPENRGPAEDQDKFLERDERSTEGGGSRHKDSRNEGCDVRSVGQEGSSYESREEPMDGREINRDPSREGHRTPGSSSADDNSRDTGIIARVGQPAMVQAPPGTKFTPEQLRQLGVINPDAFCELCCKEFCNKYFLRTHRIKKHGIYTPEFSDRSKAQHKDNSHLNLARLLERQAFDLRPALPDIEGDLECELCRRPFPSPYLLQMHKYYFHGPGQEAVQHEQLALHPQPSPHEQLRQLALHAQQQARQQHHQQQQHKAKVQEHQRRLQEHHDKFQYQREEEKEQLQFDHEKRMSESTSEEGEIERPEEIPRPSVIESAGSGESDASEDLRKLQSMILQLNRQGEMSLRCRLCNKDVGNKYFLRAHMMTEHGILGNEDVSVSTPASEGAQTPKTPCEPNPKSSSPTTPSGENQAFCNLCKKDFFSRYILQQHMLSTHGVFTPPAPPASFMERIRAEVESREDRKPQSTSRSYCEICNKELCNKYFMKTHMLKMHGINLENGVSGGVTCDLCNKELCSKYFLRVHKQNTHGLVEEGREEGEGIDRSEIESCPLCPRLFKNRKWLKTHLTSDHDDIGKEKWREIEATMVPREPIQKRGPSCSICGQCLPDLVSLQLHVIKNHGTHESIMESAQRTAAASEEAKAHPLQCSLCPFTTSTPALLVAHAHTHAQGMPSLPGVLGQTIPCPLCSQVLPNFEAYQHHLLQHQLQGLLKPLFEKETLSSESNTQGPYEPSMNKDEFVEAQTKPRRHKKRWRCSQCGRKFKSRVLCLTHVHATHNPRARGTWLGRPAVQRRLYKCRKCGAVARRLTALRQHIREQHRTGPSVPTSHATPTKPKTAGRFVMQPFLLNNESGEDGDGEEGRNEKHTLSECQFVPSLVYLPVARRVQHPLTVSFSLTPA